MIWFYFDVTEVTNFIRIINDWLRLVSFLLIIKYFFNFYGYFYIVMNMYVIFECIVLSFNNIFEYIHIDRIRILTYMNKWLCVIWQKNFCKETGDDILK